MASHLLSPFYKDLTSIANSGHACRAIIRHENKIIQIHTLNTLKSANKTRKCDKKKDKKSSNP
jgi:hypothetical protein